MLGLVYIAFEKILLEQTEPLEHEPITADVDGLSRAIFGGQIGLIALAMLFTRSSVASLQAKQGLPIATQIFGWATLSKCCFNLPFLANFC